VQLQILVVAVLGASLRHGFVRCLQRPSMDLQKANKKKNED